jgi:DNA polymerase III epsilon subunit-like protein
MTTKVIFFDTETTGLPKAKKVGALEGSNNWPDLVSICWMVFHGREHVRTEYHLIKPEGWTIPAEASNIHGITQAKALREGKPLQDIMALFAYDLADCTYIIAHNLEFDKNVVFHTLKWRMGVDPYKVWPREIMEFCTAQMSKDEMKLPPMFSYYKDYKIPKLDELYFDTFKELAPKDAHNALRDVDVLQKIVWKRWNLRDKEDTIL